MKRLLLFFLLCLMLTACDVKDPAPTSAASSPPPAESPRLDSPTPLPSTDPTEPSPEGDVFSPALSINEDAWTYERKADDGTLLINVNTAWPQLPGTVPPDILNYYVHKRETVQTTISQWEIMAEDQYRDSLSQNEEFVPYRLQQNYTVMYNEHNRLSILRESVEFTGGVHELIWAETETFDVTTGEKLSWDDLFTVSRDVYLKRLTDAVCQQIEPHKEDYFENYSELAAELFPAEYVCLSETGVVVIYNPYELAPFTRGVCRFEIPYEMIADIWKS